MTSGQLIGLVGGIAGGVIGLLGGVIGTYFSVKTTRTQAERRFQARCAAALWGLTLALIVAPLPLVLLKIIPSWPYVIVWVAYMILVLGSIPRMNRRASELREASQSAQFP